MEGPVVRDTVSEIELTEEVKPLLQKINCFISYLQSALRIRLFSIEILSQGKLGFWRQCGLKYPLTRELTEAGITTEIVTSVSRLCKVQSLTFTSV